MDPLPDGVPAPTGWMEPVGVIRFSQENYSASYRTDDWMFPSEKLSEFSTEDQFAMSFIRRRWPFLAFSFRLFLIG